MFVRYRVPDNHLTETKRGDETVHGSVHHPELAEFGGVITRAHGDGTFDLVIFPPHRMPVHVDRVRPGDAPGQFSTQPHDLAPNMPAPKGRA